MLREVPSREGEIFAREYSHVRERNNEVVRGAIVHAPRAEILFSLRDLAFGVFYLFRVCRFTLLVIPSVIPAQPRSVSHARRNPLPCTPICERLDNIDRICLYIHYLSFSLSLSRPNAHRVGAIVIHRY